MKKSNILIFMTDQQRACSVLPDNPYKAITPVLDKFRKDAVTFSRAYAPAPHCCPSRASFMTGLMPSQHGVWHNVNVGNAITRGLKEHVRPWSVDLKEAGYRMLFSGKWHVSNFQQPRDYGWEHVYPESMCHGEGLTLDEQEHDACKREIKYLKNYAVNEPTSERVPGEIKRIGQTPYLHYGDISNEFLARYFRNGDDENPFNDKTVVEAAITQLDELESETPWCMYVGTLGPHDPYIAPKRFLDLYEGMEFPLPESFDDPMDDKPALYRRTRDRFKQLTSEEHKAAIKHYLAFCSYEDWLFGKLIDKLKERGEYEDTIILYVSDHGDYLGDHGLWCKGLPAFLSCYHVPGVLKMPCGKKGSVRNEFVSLTDFGPTFLEAVGVKSPVDFAGRSLIPLMKGEMPEKWRNALFFQSNGNETYGIQRSIVTDKWRFIYNGYDYDELYNLENDPNQMKNLASNEKYAPVIRELYKKIWKFGFEHDEHIINDYIMTALADYGQGLAFED